MRPIKAVIALTAFAALVATPALAIEGETERESEELDAAAPADTPSHTPGAMDRDTMNEPAAASQSDSAEYVVQKGDTLASIAEAKLGASEKWEVIAKANHIDDPAKLRVGQKLVIPRGEAADEPQRGRF